MGGLIWHGKETQGVAAGGLAVDSVNKMEVEKELEIVEL